MEVLLYLALRAWPFSVVIATVLAIIAWGLAFEIFARVVVTGGRLYIWCLDWIADQVTMIWRSWRGEDRF